MQSFIFCCNNQQDYDNDNDVQKPFNEYYEDSYYRPRYPQSYQNLGNTCYLNSLLACFQNLNHFKQSLSKIVANNEKARVARVIQDLINQGNEEKQMDNLNEIIQNLEESGNFIRGQPDDLSKAFLQIIAFLQNNQDFQNPFLLKREFNIQAKTYKQYSNYYEIPVNQKFSEIMDSLMKDDCPQILALKTYSNKTILENQSLLLLEEVFKDKKSSIYYYHLNSIIFYNKKRSHYYSVIKRQDNQHDEWYLINDSNVRMLYQRQKQQKNWIKRELINACIYMLFYEKNQFETSEKQYNENEIIQENSEIKQENPSQQEKQNINLEKQSDKSCLVLNENTATTIILKEKTNQMNE